MKRVFVARHPIEAHLVLGILESEGIVAEVRGEALSWALGEIPITMDSLPSVWVLDDSQADRAAALVIRYEQKHEPLQTTGRQWRCPECGEMIDPQFTSCWQCGAEGPSGG